MNTAIWSCITGSGSCTRRVLAVTVLALASLPGTTVAQSWSAHISAGWAASTFTGDSDNDFVHRNSLAGGGGATFNVSRILGVRAELLYVVRGAVARDAVIDGVATQLEATFSVAYLDVPVVLIARLPRTGVAPYAFAGGQYARNVDARLRLTSPGGATVEEGDSSIASSDFALVAGAGVTVPFSTEEVFVEVRYTSGQSNIRPDRPDAPLSNSSFVLVAGLRF